MIKDKDIAHSLLPLTAYEDEWHLVTLLGTRGADSALLMQALQENTPHPSAQQHAAIEEAYPKILSTLKQDDLLVVFGSFVTVSAVLALQQEVG